MTYKVIYDVLTNIVFLIAWRNTSLRNHIITIVTKIQCLAFSDNLKVQCLPLGGSYKLSITCIAMRPASCRTGLKDPDGFWNSILFVGKYDLGKEGITSIVDLYNGRHIWLFLTKSPRLYFFYEIGNVHVHILNCRYIAIFDRHTTQRSSFS